MNNENTLCLASVVRAMAAEMGDFKNRMKKAPLLGGASSN
jgi:hypothetical protein